jgi:hypothetical protein
MAIAGVDELDGPAGEAALWGILAGRQPGALAGLDRCDIVKWASAGDEGASLHVLTYRTQCSRMVFIGRFGPGGLQAYNSGVQLGDQHRSLLYPHFLLISPQQRFRSIILTPTSTAAERDSGSQFCSFERLRIPSRDALRSFRGNKRYTTCQRPCSRYTQVSTLWQFPKPARRWRHNSSSVRMSLRQCQACWANTIQHSVLWRLSDEDTLPKHRTTFSWNVSSQARTHPAMISYTNLYRS